ncbi:MAG: aminotransferase class V-fold PLP-dependent enzyme [Candidatus Hodarchaeota archaeon]
MNSESRLGKIYYRFRLILDSEPRLRKIFYRLYRLYRLYHKIKFIKPYWGLREFFCGYFYQDRQNDNSKKILIDKFRQKLKVKGVIIPTSSGRVAIELALKVLKNNCSTKQKVIIPTYGCKGTFDPIIKVGLTPVFVDIDKNLNISKDSVSKVLNTNEDVLAIVVPHLGGCKAEVEEIASMAKEKGIVIIEDVCQSLGRKDSNIFLGTRYDMSIFSFGMGKNLMATAGGILTSRILKEDIHTEAKKLRREDTKLVKRRFRNLLFKYFSIFDRSTDRDLLSSYKYNEMHPLDAKLISLQLDKLETIIQKRRENAKIIITALYKTNYRFSIQNHKNHIYTKLSIIFEDPKDCNKLERSLYKADIDPERMYTPLHLRKFAVNFSPKVGVPISEDKYKMVFNIPVRPNLTKRQLNRIIKAIENANS